MRNKKKEIIANNKDTALNNSLNTFEELAFDNELSGFEYPTIDNDLKKSNENKKPVKKKSLKRKLITGILSGGGITLAILYGTLQTINYFNKQNLTNKDIKPPIVTLPPSNNTNTPPDDVANTYTTQQLDEASFSHSFLVYKILNDVNHNYNLISNNFEFISINFNHQKNNLVLLLTDNDKVFEVSYSLKEDVSLPNLEIDIKNPSDALSELTCILSDDFLFSEATPLNDFKSENSSLIKYFIQEQNQLSNVRFLGYSNPYLTNNLTQTETETIDIYGFGFKENTYTKFICTFGRPTSNYYENDIVSDIASYIEEYSSYENITEQQNHELLNKYSLFTNINNNALQSQNNAEYLILYIQEYIEQCNSTLETTKDETLEY